MHGLNEVNASPAASIRKMVPTMSHVGSPLMGVPRQSQVLDHEDRADKVEDRDDVGLQHRTERETRLELATAALGRRCSTN